MSNNFINHKPKIWTATPSSAKPKTQISSQSIKRSGNLKFDPTFVECGRMVQRNINVTRQRKGGRTTDERTGHHYEVCWQDHRWGNGKEWPPPVNTSTLRTLVGIKEKQNGEDSLHIFQRPIPKFKLMKNKKTKNSSITQLFRIRIEKNNRK